MKNFERIARIEGVGTDGVFDMTLATEGEASDGHSLSMKGGTIPERMPLLASHWNDPFGQLGSITNPEKMLKDSPPRLRATGNIEMEGPLADARRDLAHMINQGHVNAVSIRWDEVPGKSIRRVNLPSDHPYFVDAETEKGEARWGIFFEEWTGREGSIVALGADKGALIGRAEQTEGEISTYWRAMADAIPTTIDMLTKLRDDATRCLQDGATVADLINAVASDNDAETIAEALQECRIGDHTVLLPGPIADQLEDERAEREIDPVTVDSQPVPDQEPGARADQPEPIDWSLDGVFESFDSEEFARILSEGMDEQDVRIKRIVQEMIDLRTGKVA